MIQTTTGLFVIGWKLALALIAGSGVITTIGVYLLARFTTVFDAYAGERAKLLAQFHNLDRLVEQTEKLTATTEAIKARVSDEVWDRQMRWSFKKDTYIRLMELFAQLGVSYDMYRQAQRLRLKYPNSPKHQTTLDESLTKLLALREDLSRVKYSAPLVISAEADNILGGTENLEELDHTDPAFQQKCERNMNIANDIASALMPVAQKDLGYRP